MCIHGEMRSLFSLILSFEDSVQYDQGLHSLLLLFFVYFRKVQRCSNFVDSGQTDLHTLHM